MVPTKSLPRGIVRNDSIRSSGGTRKSVRFSFKDRWDHSPSSPGGARKSIGLSFHDRWDPMVKAEDVQLKCPQRARDIQLQPPRRSSDISSKLSRKCNREESKPRRSRSLLNTTANNGAEKPPAMNMTTRSYYFINCALDIVGDSTEHAQISKELVFGPPSETHRNSQMIPYCFEEVRTDIFLSAACPPFE